MRGVRRFLLSGLVTLLASGTACAQSPSRPSRGGVFLVTPNCASGLANCAGNNAVNSTIQWYPLTQSQFDYLTGQLSRISVRKPLLIQCKTNALGCHEFAGSLASAFARVQWPAAVQGYVSTDNSVQGAAHEEITISNDGAAGSLKDAFESTLPDSVRIAGQGYKDRIIIWIGQK